MGWSAAFTQPAAGYKDERRRRSMELHTIGIDLGKTVFHLVGLNPVGEVVVRKKFTRKQLLHFTAMLRIFKLKPVLSNPENRDVLLPALTANRRPFSSSIASPP